MENETPVYEGSDCLDAEIEAPEPHTALVLAAALALGILGDGLLRAWPWGVNAALWILSCLAAVFLLDSARAVWSTPMQRALLATATLFSITFAWRDAPMLNGLSLVVIFTCIVLAASPAPVLRWWRASMLRCAIQGIDTALSWCVLPFRLFERNLGILQRAERERFQVAAAVLRGLLIALPFLFLFGMLLTSADVHFKEFIKDLFDFNLKTIASHAAIFAACTGVAAGLLLLLLEGPLDLVRERQEPRGPNLGGIEANVVMVSLDLLFGAFTLMQFAYFFGGDERVQAVPGLTYAEYARHGFFELCATAALAFSLLLLIDWLIRDTGTAARACFRGLALLQVVLLFVILASARDRMALYCAAYGMTLLRFYVVAFLYWLAVLFVWFTLTVLTGRRHLFMGGVIVTGALAVLLLHAVNPDARVMRANIERFRQTERFDMPYALTLSAGAVPVLYEEDAVLPPNMRDLVLARPWLGESRDSWRSWNLDRHRSRAAVAESKPVTEPR